MVLVLFAAGDHVPVTPLVDIDGNTKGAPEQMDDMAAKVGVSAGVMVMVNVVVVAHCPAFGVNV